MFTLKDEYLADYRWHRFPKLKAMATNYLEESETLELFSLITAEDSYNRYLLDDRSDITMAFSFSRTPQGREYWARIATRIELRIEAELSGLIDPDPTPAKRGWEPDKVNGTDVMRATRDIL